MRLRPNLFGPALFGVTLATAFAAQAAVAQAETVLTINVPVQFHSLSQQVQSVRVVCFIQGLDPVSGGKLTPQYDSQFQDIVPDAKGDYNGVVSIVWDSNAFYGRPNELAMVAGPSLTSYCTFNLRVGGSLYTPNFAQSGQPANPAIAAKPGTTFVSKTPAS